MDRRDGSARGRVLDAGVLIAVERGDEWARGYARDRRRLAIIPAPVLAQVWRDGRRQAILATFVAEPTTIVEPFDENAAKAAGVLLGRSGTSDIADASVIIAARSHRALIVTTDADDIRRLDPEVPIAELP